MTDSELICPKCGYHNQPHRVTCKNCGEALTAEQAMRQHAPLTRRRKPLRLRQGRDWLVASVGLVLLLFAFIFANLAVAELAKHSPAALAALGGVLLALYLGMRLFLLPLIYRCIYLLGHGSATGRIGNSYLVERGEDDPGEPEEVAWVEFEPALAKNPRFRRLECREVDTYRMLKESREIQVFYSFIDPAIALLEGE